jgi:cyclin-dependent kinase 10
VQLLINTAYGIVSRAKDRSSSDIVALKQIRIEASERHNGIPITALREISILRSLKHPNIINVIDIAVDDGQRRFRRPGGQDYEDTSDNVYMVMEYAQQVSTPTPELWARVSWTWMYVSGLSPFAKWQGT